MTSDEDLHARSEFPPLDVLQRWMQSVMTHPQGVAIGAAQSSAGPSSIADVVTASHSLSAEARLAIYGHAYFARLLECLRSEFSAVRHAAGEEAFEGLAANYLVSTPSRSYTLGELGRGFPEYLLVTRPERTAATPDFADFLIDLARLERCYSEVFDGPGPERGPNLSLENISFDEFATCRIAFHDSVRLVTLRFPCHDYASSVRQEGEPPIPPPAVTHLVIFRRDYVVRRVAVTPEQFELLRTLETGETIQTALQKCVQADPAYAGTAPQLQENFTRWTRFPLFRAVLALDEPNLAATGL